MSPGTLAAEPLWCTRLTYFQFSSVQTRTPHSFSVGSATPCVGALSQDVGGWVCAHSPYVACIYTPSTAATAHRVSVAMSQPTKDTKVMAIHTCTRSTAPPHRTTKQHQHHAAHCAQSTMQHTVHTAHRLLWWASWATSMVLERPRPRWPAPVRMRCSRMRGSRMSRQIARVELLRHASRSTLTLTLALTLPITANPTLTLTLTPTPIETLTPTLTNPNPTLTPTSL